MFWCPPLLSPHWSMFWCPPLLSPHWIMFWCPPLLSPHWSMFCLLYHLTSCYLNCKANFNFPVNLLCILKWKVARDWDDFWFVWFDRALSEWPRMIWKLSVHGQCNCTVDRHCRPSMSRAQMAYRRFLKIFRESQPSGNVSRLWKILWEVETLWVHFLVCL